MVERRDFASGAQMLRDAFEFCRRIGWHVSQPEFKAALAEALAGVGAIDEALETVDDALAGVGQRNNGQWWYVPELLRIKGEILLQQHADSSLLAAEALFTEAGVISREQDALFWELRAALGLARLHLQQGRLLETANPGPRL
jgi:predicted ATPase